MNLRNIFITVLVIPVLVGTVRAGSAAVQTSTGGGASCSIVSRDPVTGDLGIAVLSALPCVGISAPWASASAGAIVTQAEPNLPFGPEGLRILGVGRTAQETLDSLLSADHRREYRQLGIVDRMGNSAAFTGTGCPPVSGQRLGPGYAVQGEFLGNGASLDSMASAYERTPGDLAVRLLAGIGAAGRGPWRSGALLVVREGAGYGARQDRFVDIRVDEHADPAGEMRRIFAAWIASSAVERRMAAVDRFNSNRQYAAAQEETRRIVESLNARLKEHPDDPEVLNDVATVLTAYDLAKERAVELSTRAVRLAPGEARYLETHAECLFRVGKVEEAIRFASELVTKEPGNERYRERLRKYLGAKGN